MLMLTSLSFAMFLCIFWDHLYFNIFPFEGQNVKNKKFFVKCFLPAFYIVAPGQPVLLELFASRAYVASYHGYPIYPPTGFLRGCRSFTSRKLHVSVRTFLCFFHQFNET